MFTIFYFAGKRDPREIAQALAMEGSTRWLPGGDLLITVAPEGKERGASFRFIFQTHIARAVHALTHRPVDLVLVDNRPPESFGTQGEERTPFAETEGAKLLAALLRQKAASYSGVKKRRIVMILADGEDLPMEAFEAGNLRVGGVLVEPFKRGGLLSALGRHLVTPEGGKVALCLAGGGIEGLLYELGVLIALDRVMVNKRVVDFDIFCGISAGAFISSFLANGVSPQELVTGLQNGNEKVDKIERRMLFWPNFREVPARIIETAKEILRYGKGVDLEALLWGLVPSGGMDTHDLKWYLERQLTKPGMTNNFAHLKKELYIGVTDQDNSTHVVIGEHGLMDVPISHAVMASAALVPFYPPQRIMGRYYIDGAFTRTTNIGVAVRHDARLIIVVNPAVPFYSSQPGMIYRYGGVFSTMQAIKGLISARFFQDYENADDLFPGCFIHLFFPEGEDLKEMKGTLMKFFYRLTLVDIAYRRTIQKIRERYELMEGDFRRFGIELVDPDSIGDEPILGKLQDKAEGVVVDLSYARKRAGRK